MHGREARGLLRIVPLLVGLAFLILAVAGTVVTVADFSCAGHPDAIVCTGGGD